MGFRGIGAPGRNRREALVKEIGALRAGFVQEVRNVALRNLRGVGVTFRHPREGFRECHAVGDHGISKCIQFRRRLAAFENGRHLRAGHNLSV